MAQLNAILNHIIFQFEEDETKHMGISQFKEATDWGFEFAATSEGMESARYVRVIAVGPDADPDIQPGMRVCVDKLMWTTDFEFEGESYWRTDSDQVLFVDNPA
jgi:hypothetical protein